MKTRLIRCGVILAIAALLLSSIVLAGPGEGQGGPSEDPGGVCAVVADLPLPASVIDALLELFGCDCFRGCDGGSCSGPPSPPNCD